MHLLFRENRSIDEQAQAEALHLAPAPVLALSFSDSDLSVLWRAAGEADWLRPVRLSRLRHPMSVDLFLERTIPGSGVVFVRLLGGLEYWRYGAEELAAACRREGVALAIVPGCDSWDPALTALSTVPMPTLERLHGFLKHGGSGNNADLVGLLRNLGGLGIDHGRRPRPVPMAGYHRRGSRRNGRAASVVFYRSHLLADDVAPFEALGRALEERGLDIDLVYVASLKQPECVAFLSRHLRETAPAVILNATFFSAGNGGSPGTVLDAAGVPVLQLLQPGIGEAVWDGSPRGLGAADLAMQVVLPEIDGRLLTAPVSFKQVDDSDGFSPSRNVAWGPGIALAADRAAGWARLAYLRPSEKRLAIVLSDYPGIGGQAGHAVGLDSFESLVAMLSDLRDAGYDVGREPLPGAGTLAATLLRTGDRGTGHEVGFEGGGYRNAFAALPDRFRGGVEATWGEPAASGYRFTVIEFGHISVAVQPDRIDAGARRDSYHDSALPPGHRFIAFHLWLRTIRNVDALVQLGAHGSVEWLPGKAMAPGPECAPSVLLRGLPVIYPFICNDPGEAAAAKRRLGAAVITHLTPPIRDAGTREELGEIERLMDEYAAASGLDQRRCDLLREQILQRSALGGVWQESGAEREADADAGLVQLGSWLCDVKEFQIRDGLHVFGRPGPNGMVLHEAVLRGAPGADAGDVAAALGQSPERERSALLAALDGRFVAPGPAGAPSRGRPDVLPTGRNPFSVDPRGIPTRSAMRLAERTAAVLLARHEQDRGEPLRAVMIDLWGSTSLRTGGEDLALALILLGVAPEWDGGSGRVTGFSVLPLATLDRPRVDVTLRISGFFRDGFPEQIALMDQVISTVAARDEDGSWNGLAAERKRGGTAARIYGAGPGAYGAGIETLLAGGEWQDGEVLARSFLDAGSWSYGATGDGVRDRDGFARRVSAVEALVHLQDHAETDLLDGLDVAGYAGGFAAAAAALGAEPAVWHTDISRIDQTRLRPLAQQVALAVRARAANPEWIAGMMRHGARGAAEIARTVEALHAFAATLPEPCHGRFDAQFELLYAATLGNEVVDGFLRRENPPARTAMATRFREAVGRGEWRPRSNGAALEDAA